MVGFSERGYDRYKGTCPPGRIFPCQDRLYEFLGPTSYPCGSWIARKAPVHEDHQDRIHHQLLWSRIRLTLREPFAEFCGTAIMVFFGNGSVAQVLLSVGNKAAPGGNGYGAYQSISWG